MIIVEGPDGAGKTTLVGLISKEFPQLKMSRILMRNDKEEEQRLRLTVRERVYSALGHEVKGQGPPYLHDRLFYSEIVYGNVLRGNCKFTDDESEYINRVLEVLNPPVVFCLPPFEVVKANVGESQQMGGVTENIGALYNTYVGIAKIASGITRYNYTAEKPDLVLDKVAKYLERRKEREW